MVVFSTDHVTVLCRLIDVFVLEVYCFNVIVDAKALLDALTLFDAVSLAVPLSHTDLYDEVVDE